jgi:hypothetical protein
MVRAPVAKPPIFRTCAYGTLIPAISRNSRGIPW